MKSLEVLLKEGKTELSKAGVSEADLDAWYLLEEVCGVSRGYYFAHMDDLVDEKKAIRYQQLIHQRAKHIPLQHLTNKAYFMGMEFYVNEHVLIPRQDTEVLVEEVLKLVPEEATVLDMCTGSGCILISLLKMKQKLSGVGADISKEALAVAKKNQDLQNVSATWVESDLFERIDGRYDIIVSNPPYIPTGVIESLEEEVKNHDPMTALDGKEDGLYFYRKITEEAEKYLNRDGWLCFEIGYDQGAAVREEMRKRGYKNIKCIKDLAGLDRVVIAQKCEVTGGKNQDV